MLIPLRQLIDRRRYPPTRADGLAWLRTRYSVHGNRAKALRPYALAIMEAKLELARSFRDVSACLSCERAVGCKGVGFEGGRCCGTQTSTVFTTSEVAALSAAGRSSKHWSIPKGAHRGCVFRGETGCSLDPADRPAICHMYICDELRAELRAGPKWEVIQARRQALQEAVQAFADASGHGETSPVFPSLVQR